MREIFFKRSFYEMLMVNKAMVNSELSSGEGNIYFEKYSVKNSLYKKAGILIFRVSRVCLKDLIIFQNC